MVMKSLPLGIVNTVFSLVIYFSTPIISYAVPRDYIIYGYLLTISLIAIMFMIDAWNSDHTQKNFHVMKKAGISPLEIWGSAATTILGFQVPGILLMLYGMETYNPEWDIPTLKDHFSMSKLMLATAIVFSTDTAFWVMHRFLHEHTPRIHMLHHACVFSSQTTNLFFHPVDLACEFTAPVVMMYLITGILLNDPWMFALCSAITQAFYSSRHDEFLGGKHLAHHRGCATSYFIYIDYFYSDPKKEKVRHLVKPFQKLE